MTGALERACSRTGVSCFSARLMAAPSSARDEGAVTARDASAGHGETAPFSIHTATRPGSWSMIISPGPFTANDLPRTTAPSAPAKVASPPATLSLSPDAPETASRSEPAAPKKRFITAPATSGFSSSAGMTAMATGAASAPVLTRRTSLHVPAMARDTAPAPAQTTASAPPPLSRAATPAGRLRSMRFAPSRNFTGWPVSGASTAVNCASAATGAALWKSTGIARSASASAPEAFQSRSGAPPSKAKALPAATPMAAPAESAGWPALDSARQARMRPAGAAPALARTATSPPLTVSAMSPPPSASASAVKANAPASRAIIQTSSDCGASTTPSGSARTRPASEP